MQKEYITYNELNIGSQGINILGISVLTCKNCCVG